MYTIIIDEIELRLKKKFLGVISTKSKDRTQLGHLLFMIDEIRVMKDIEKASRWIGWLTAIAVTKYNLMDNEEVDELVRVNKNAK